MIPIMSTNPPKPKETWVSKARTDIPFSERTYTIEVKEVKGDWVWYNIGIFDCFQPLDRFLRLYEPQEIQTL